MIKRYTPKDFDYLWSEDKKYLTWLKVELAACKAMEDFNLVPKGISDQINSINFVIDSNRINEIEKLTKHDVIAFLTYIEEVLGDPSKYLHKGLTSSDIVDTSFALLLVESLQLIIKRLDKLLLSLIDVINKHRSTIIMGRTHGMHAELITLGLILSGYYAEFKRSKFRLQQAQSEIAIGKLSGAVGTYIHLNPQIELKALELIGLKPETVATQVVSRDRHAFMFSCLGILASGIERFATNIRHFQRTELQEIKEFFSPEQKGSSAMPHKTNPIISENLCGLARIVRSNVIPSLENIPLWHERDISHSSVERIIAPDTTTIMAYMLDKCDQLISQMIVYPENIQKNIDKSNNLCFSEAVLLSLIDKGLLRQTAYSLVQKIALNSFNSNIDFQLLLKENNEIKEFLSENEIDKCFSVSHMLNNIDEIIDRALN